MTLQGLTRGSQAGRITVFELREDRREMAKAYPGCEVYDPESEEGKKGHRRDRRKGRRGRGHRLRRLQVRL